MIRVFPRKTKWIPDDELSFIGDPPLFLPDMKYSVYISVAFTWDIDDGLRLYESWSRYYRDVRIGGPAFDDPGDEFFPGRFIKPGVTITSRGCPKNCPWCYVPKREGKIRELEIKPGHIIQDNNLLACSKNHIIQVFDMLRGQKKAAIFSGGIDPDFLKDWHRDLFDSIRFKEIWLSCDHKKAIKQLCYASKILEGIPQYKKRCYAMIGFNGESIYDAEYRLEKVYELGFFPFSQLYQGKIKKQYSKEWRDLNRKWSRPAAYNSKKPIQELPE